MITVFGSINMDLIATTARLPKPGETVAGNGFATAAELLIAPCILPTT